MLLAMIGLLDFTSGYSVLFYSLVGNTEPAAVSDLWLDVVV
jgi:hypothetical protein